MANKKNKMQGKTNLYNATPEQLDRLYQNAAEAYMWLYKRVAERTIKEMLEVNRKAS